MAIEARMHAVEVRQRGGGRQVPCDPDADGALEISDDESVIAWLRPSVSGKTHVRYDAQAQSQEIVELSALWEPNGPNREWAQASPSGSLTLAIDNPAVFGYVKPGRHYRITIEEVRGPRSSRTNTETITG